MPLESDGLSRDEFLMLQQQLLELRNRNYELQEELKRKDHQLNQSNPKNEALQFASKLISRASKKDDKNENEIESLRRKLVTQEEEFKLQQSTLLGEMNLISNENSNLKKQLELNSGDDKVVELMEELKLLKDNKAQLEEENNKLKDNLKVSDNKLKESTENCDFKENLIKSLEDKMLDYKGEINISEKTINQLKSDLEQANLQNTQLRDRNDEISAKCQNQMDEMSTLKLNLIDLEENATEFSKILKQSKESEENLKQRLDEKNMEISMLSDKIKELEDTLSAKQEQLTSAQQELDDFKKEFESEEKNKANIQNQVSLVESRYQLELDDLQKNFELERESKSAEIKLLENQLKDKDEEKQLAMKKQAAVVKELQKMLKEERKRADYYERKSEERSDWQVVNESDGRSSQHTYDGNESVSSLSAVESENVELINRLVNLQKLHSENMDRLLQLESENSRLQREVVEKGELIENWIREKPISNSNGSATGNNSKIDAGLRRLLNTIGPDQSVQDVREMNKKLQRLLEETLSKNIILQRDIQTLLERTEM